MEEFLTQLVGNASGWWAYGTVFAVLVACGLGVPLPEDISLILGGFLAHKGAARLPVMMVVGFAGILVGDTIIYLAGRRIGSRVGRSGGFFARIVTPEKRARVEALFHQHGQKIVMIARFLPGVRAVTYFTAGSARMSYWRFIAWDGLAAILSAPVFVYLGYRFGSELEVVIEMMQDGQTAVAALIVVLGLGYWLFRRRKASRRQATAAHAPPATASNAVTPFPAYPPKQVPEPAQRTTASGGD